MACFHEMEIFIIDKRKTRGKIMFGDGYWGFIELVISDQIIANKRLEKLTWINMAKCSFLILFQEALLILEIGSSECDKIHDLGFTVRKWVDWQTLVFPSASRYNLKL